VVIDLVAGDVTGDGCLPPAGGAEPGALVESPTHPTVSASAASLIERTHSLAFQEGRDQAGIVKSLMILIAMVNSSPPVGRESHKWEPT
jgi:hypothetical protein